MRVLIVTVPFELEGGVASFIKGIHDKFTFKPYLFFLGMKSERTSILKKIFRLLKDYVKFIKVIAQIKPDLVFVNPSMSPNSFIRDSLFVLISNIFNIKCLVFWHGWRTEYFEKHIKNYLWQKCFTLTYCKAKAHIVLAEEFRKQMQNIYMGRIFISMTAFNETELNNYCINRNHNLTIKDKNRNILFLSRIEKEKGVFIAIDSYNILKKEYPDICLIIAGDGSTLKEAVLYVKQNNIEDVRFTGYVKGNDKYELLSNSMLFFFPTYDAEGQPVAILEAMAMGLPIITRPVAGIKDYFQNDKMGYALDSLDPKIFSQKIKHLLCDKELLETIKNFNLNYASSHLTSKIIASNIENIIRKVTV